MYANKLFIWGGNVLITCWYDRCFITVQNRIIPVSEETAEVKFLDFCHSGDIPNRVLNYADVDV